MSGKDTEILLLDKYLPPGTAKPIHRWLKEENAQLKISRPRRTKLGDYRAPHQGKGHRISVNGDLNPYAFLVTLVHEFAHLGNWKSFGHKVKPHGPEWQEEFRDMLNPFLSRDIFPDDVSLALNNYLEKPGATKCTDPTLLRTLNKYNTGKAVIYLEDIPENTLFSLNGKRIFEKGEQLRKRFKCRDLNSGRYYLVSPLAEVFLVDK